MVNWYKRMGTVVELNCSERGALETRRPFFVPIIPKVHEQHAHSPHVGYPQTLEATR